MATAIAQRASNFLGPDFSHTLGFIFEDSEKIVLISAVACGAIATAVMLTSPFSYIFFAKIITTGVVRSCVPSIITKLFLVVSYSSAKKVYAWISDDYRLREIFNNSMDHLMHADISRDLRLGISLMSIPFFGETLIDSIISFTVIMVALEAIHIYKTYEGTPGSIELNRIKSEFHSLNEEMRNGVNNVSRLREIVKKRHVLITRSEQLGFQEKFRDFREAKAEIIRVLGLLNVDLEGPKLIRKIIEDERNLLPENEKEKFIQKVVEMEGEFFQILTHQVILEIVASQNYSPVFIQNFRAEIRNLGTRFRALSENDRKDVREKINEESGPESSEAKIVWAEMRRISSLRLLQGNNEFFSSVAFAIALQGWIP